MFTRRGRQSSGTPLRIFFATDIHGSDVCFRKFINASKFYDARYLILGGDITGKTLIPIERTSTGWQAKYLDHEYTGMTDSERQDLERYIRQNGQYPVEGELDELTALASETYRMQVFERVVKDSIKTWVEFAEERLAGTDTRCFVTPGNDDFWAIDDVLRGSETVEFAEGRCIQLDDRHEMITTGYSNPTPWHSPREIGEAGLKARIEAMFAEVADPTNLVAVLHAPPFNSKLDRAPAIDAEFQVHMDISGIAMASVGSTAVREFIESRQPLLSLHGHVHESRGVMKLGRTTCINPGSEYTEGTLLGALVTVDGGRVMSHQLVVG